MNKLLFKEVQRFGSWWLWLILLVITAVSTIPFIYGIYSQEVKGIPWGDNPTSTTVLIILLVVISLVTGGLCYFIAKMKLTVKIKSDGIWYKYPPQYVKWKSIGKAEIDHFELRTYKPVREYGGWGIKGNRKNRVLSASGNVGLQIFFKDGKKLLIGTQRKQALEYAMNKLMNKL